MLWLCEVLLLRLTASGVRDCVRRFDNGSGKT